jgi:hypothetical protein
MIVTVLAAAVTFWAAYDGGTYSLASRATFAIGLAWATIVAVLVGILPAGRRWRPALGPSAFLAGFALWTLLSTAWAVSAESAFFEFDRAALFLVVFAFAALAASRVTAPRIADGIGFGVAAIGLLALAVRLFPSLVSQEDLKVFLPTAYTRLSYPVGYWNGLAILLALSFPLLLRTAAAGRSPLVRGLALAPLPALSGAIYLTASRGGVLTAVLGVLAFAVCARDRWPIVEASVLAGVGSVLAVLVLHGRPALVNPPVKGSPPSGHGAAVLIFLICVGAGAALFARIEFLPTLRMAPAAGRAAVALAVFGVAIGVAFSHPVRHFEAFKQPPPPLPPNEFVQSHLFSVNGSGRWQFWGASLDEFASKPVEGRGAGSFEAWWAQHGSLGLFVRDAHSLYLEVLGELGAIGAILLFAALLCALAIALQGLVRAPPGERTIRAALLATGTAFLFALGIDWMWELTAVSIVGFACLGLLCGLGTGPEPEEPRRRRRPSLALVLPVTVIGLAVIATQGIALVAQGRLDASRAAVERRDTQAALSAAKGARDVEPWASTPYLQLALIEEQAGYLGQAERRIVQAIKRDREDWRLWLTRARIQTKRGHIAAARKSLARARSLNPRSLIFTGD